MKFKDIIWISILIGFSLILIFEQSREVFESFTNDYPYLMGFIKTSILATMGELLALRIATGKYKGLIGIQYKFIIWGLIGMTFVLVFPLFSDGVEMAQLKLLLPSVKNEFLSSFLTAILTSILLNLIFAPTFMAFHRITDTYIELGEGSWNKIIKVRLNSVIDRINWNHYINFVLLKTIPFFWIPAHTITFLLPPQYRIIMAASLSIALGLILSLSKRKKVS